MNLPSFGTVLAHSQPVLTNEILNMRNPDRFQVGTFEGGHHNVLTITIDDMNRKSEDAFKVFEALTEIWKVVVKMEDPHRPPE